MLETTHIITLVPPVAGSRFDTVPTLAIADDEIQYKAFLKQSNQIDVQSESGVHTMRYAAYIRVSDEEQLKGYSLDAQERIIRDWVRSQGGTLTKVYAERGESGTTTNRTAFQQLRIDARHHRFDAIIVHKFDRFARNRYDALAIKSLFRYDYKLKVFSVSEPSEDSDGVIGALIEGIMECVADWYSRNLASEVRKGRKERVQQGMHNNLPPFGYIKNTQKLLVPEPDEVRGLLRAYTAYTTGKFSDHDIAELLNNEGYKTKQNRPFSKDTVRLMLQNQTYLGKVRYQEYQRNADRSRNHNAPTEWYQGKHEPVIPQDLFDKVQQVRADRAVRRQLKPQFASYLLQGMVYCYRCCNSAPAENPFPAFGRMRAQGKTRTQRYYRCRAKDFNHTCDQKGVACDIIEAQVVNALMALKPPLNWRTRITEAMAEMLGEQKLEERLAEIRETIERMDFRWDQGFITDKSDYLEKRVRLQQELEQLMPIAEDELERAVDILANFRHYWDSCNGDPDAQYRLIKLIVERVYVQDEDVVALTLKADYHVVMGHKTKEPTTIVAGSNSYRDGGDGSRTRDLCLDRAVC